MGVGPVAELGSEIKLDRPFRILPARCAAGVMAAERQSQGVSLATAHADEPQRETHAAKIWARGLLLD